MECGTTSSKSRDILSSSWRAFAVFWLPAIAKVGLGVGAHEYVLEMRILFQEHLVFLPQEFWGDLTPTDVWLVGVADDDKAQSHQFVE